MGWEMPWYTMTDDSDVDFGVDEWHGTNAFISDGDRAFRTYFINSRGDEAMGSLELPRHHRARAPRGLGGLPRWLPPDPALPVVELARRVQRRSALRRDSGADPPEPLTISEHPDLLAAAIRDIAQRHGMSTPAPG